MLQRESSKQLKVFCPPRDEGDSSFLRIDENDYSRIKDSLGNLLWQSFGLYSIDTGEGKKGEPAIQSVYKVEPFDAGEIITGVPGKEKRAILLNYQKACWNINSLLDKSRYCGLELAMIVHAAESYKAWGEILKIEIPVILTGEMTLDFNRHGDRWALAEQEADNLSRELSIFEIEVDLKNALFGLSMDKDLNKILFVWGLIIDRELLNKIVAGYKNFYERL